MAMCRFMPCRFNPSSFISVRVSRSHRKLNLSTYSSAFFKSCRSVVRTCSSVTGKYCLKICFRWILYYIFVFSSRFSNFSLNFGSASVAEVVSNPAVLADVNHVSLYFVDTLNESFDLVEVHIVLHFAGLNCHACRVRYSVATNNSKFWSS